MPRPYVFTNDDGGSQFLVEVYDDTATVAWRASPDDAWGPPRSPDEQRKPQTVQDVIELLETHGYEEAMG